MVVAPVIAVVALLLSCPGPAEAAVEKVSEAAPSDTQLLGLAVSLSANKSVYSITARAEGCNQPVTSGCCCGCAIITGFGSGSGTYNHCNGLRGTMVSTSSGHSYFYFGDMSGL